MDRSFQPYAARWPHRFYLVENEMQKTIRHELHRSDERDESGSFLLPPENGFVETETAYEITINMPMRMTYEELRFEFCCFGIRISAENSFKKDLRDITFGQTRFSTFRHDIFLGCKVDPNTFAAMLVHDKLRIVVQKT